MKPSADIKKQPARDFLLSMRYSNLLVAGILAIIQPQLFLAGMRAFTTLMKSNGLVNEEEAMHSALDLWGNPFSAISIISNRDTPLHRDSFGRPEWMDLLLAIGRYDHGRLELPGLGIRFKYNHRAAMAFSGRLLLHGATCDGDRACIAYYMRDNVMNTLSIPIPQWFNVKEIDTAFAHVGDLE